MLALKEMKFGKTFQTKSLIEDLYQNKKVNLRSQEKQNQIRLSASPVWRLRRPRRARSLDLSMELALRNQQLPGASQLLVTTISTSQLSSRRRLKSRKSSTSTSSKASRKSMTRRTMTTRTESSYELRNEVPKNLIG